jgi:hypothetical protein
MSLIGWRRQAARNRHHSLSCRPRLEALEDRLLPSTYAVINTADSGQGSMRQALLDANANPGPNTIIFDIPGNGAHTIQPLSPLPTITRAVVLDGTYQPGYSGTPLIVLNGSAAGPGADGLSINSSDSTVRGLVIDGFAGNGVVVQGDGNAIAGNFIGTDLSGTGAVPNNWGVFIVSGSDNAVGGTGPSDGNLISGNATLAVNVAGDGNRVEGNFVGTDVTGTRVLHNRGGIIVNGSDNTVGGTARG